MKTQSRRPTHACVMICYWNLLFCSVTLFLDAPCFFFSTPECPSDRSNKKCRSAAFVRLCCEGYSPESCYIINEWPLCWFILPIRIIYRILRKVILLRAPRLHVCHACELGECLILNTAYRVCSGGCIPTPLPPAAKRESTSATPASAAKFARVVAGVLHPNLFCLNLPAFDLCLGPCQPTKQLQWLRQMLFHWFVQWREDIINVIKQVSLAVGQV